MTLRTKLGQAIRTLKAGGVIAFPTETVFGIGALLSKSSAIRKIFKLKKRPRSKPLQILVDSLEMAKKLGKFNAQALELARSGWPGPLTLVVYKKRGVPKLVTGGTAKVGLRLPDHKTILTLIKRTGPIVATSANRAGEKPGLTEIEVKTSLSGIDYILPGKVKTGRASRVIDITGKGKILRGS